MDPLCTRCGYDYHELTSATAPTLLRREAAAFADVVRARRPRATVPVGSWSAIEYAGHVRDVLLVTRERTLTARRETEVLVIAMGREERVEWGEYDDLTMAQAADGVTQAARWLAHTWRRMPAADWERTVLYNYPTSAIRDLTWVATHTVHELVHHRQDIEALTRST